MTPEQLRQKLQDRRNGFAAEVEKAEAEIRQLNAVAAQASAHIVELDFALEALDAVPAPRIPEKPQPKKTDALAECVGTMKQTFLLPLREGVTDRMAQEQLAKAGHKFRLPTVRNALIALGKESRAVAETASDKSPTERVAVSSLSEATPNSDGAGTDPGPMPAFLKRSKEAAE